MWLHDYPLIRLKSIIFLVIWFFEKKILQSFGPLQMEKFHKMFILVFEGNSAASPKLNFFRIF